MRRPFRAVAVLAGLFVLEETACWRTVATSVSPNGQYTVRVRELPLFADSSIRVEMAGGWRPPLVVPLYGDAWLGFTQVAWAPDATRAGVLVVNPIGTHLQIGLDTQERAVIPFAQVRALVADEIRRTCRLTAEQLQAHGNDPVEWAIQEDRSRELCAAAGK